MGIPLRVLVVEDSETDAEILALALRRGGYEPTWQRVDTASGLRSALAERVWDIVVADHSMPQFSAPAALEVLKECALDVPFIIVSGSIGEDAAVAAMKAGAHDFIPKENLARLLPAVEREVREAKIRRERRLAGEALRVNEERLRLALDTARMGTWDWDVVDNVLVWSDNVELMFGLKPGSLAANYEAALALIHPADRPTVIQVVSRALRDPDASSNLRVEVRMLLPNGAIRWVETSGRMFHNQGGAPVRMMGTVTDITERKRAEEAMRQLARRLERSNAELMALHEVARVLAGTINLQAVYHVMFREVAQRLLDAPYFSILLLDPATKGFSSTFHIADGRELETPPTWLDTSPMQTALQAREPHVVSLDEPPPHKSRTAEAENSPRLRSALYVPLLSGDHAIGVMVVQHTLPNAFSAADTTLLSVLASQAAVAIENAQLYAQTLHYADSMEQRVNERTQELQLERAQLQAILDGITEGVVYADLLQDRTQYMNLAFTRLTGFGSSDIVGQPRAVYRAILHIPAQPGGVAPLFDASGADRNFWHGEVKIVRRDGSEFDAAVTISAILGDDTQPIAEVALVRDIGQEKLLQAQKDRFIASASHELRTPVSNLQMRLYLAKNQPEKLHDHLNAIERATRHLAHLIEDMLDVSRFERNQVTLHPKRVVLQEVIDGVLADERGQAESKLVALDQDLPDTPLYADVDADRFKQIVTNLLDNAINYTPEGGQVCIRLAREQREHGASAVLSVQDTGVGISAKALPRIFEPFYRAAEGAARGTGLGLTIARELTELHGGRIVVESEPGKGSVFTVRIPLNE